MIGNRRQAAIRNVRKDGSTDGIEAALSCEEQLLQRWVTTGIVKLPMESLVSLGKAEDIERLYAGCHGLSLRLQNFKLRLAEELRRLRRRVSLEHGKNRQGFFKERGVGGGYLWPSIRTEQHKTLRLQTANRLPNWDRAYPELSRKPIDHQPVPRPIRSLKDPLADPGIDPFLLVTSGFVHATMLSGNRMHDPRGKRI